MKKNYTKPEIMFENFTISTNLAAGCDFKTGLQSYESDCGYYSSGFDAIIFHEATSCSYIPPDDFDKVCYHNPDMSKNLFNS